MVRCIILNCIHLSILMALCSTLISIKHTYDSIGRLQKRTLTVGSAAYDTAYTYTADRGDDAGGRDLYLHLYEHGEHLKGHPERRGDNVHVR